MSMNPLVLHGTRFLYSVLLAKPSACGQRVKRILRTIRIAFRTQGCLYILKEIPKVLIPQHFGVWELDVSKISRSVSCNQALSIRVGDEAVAALVSERQ